ncbi:acetylcholinesterase-like isoform X2 [Dermacentor albipictus]|uniref:acetylcholinesterase-like isoform X2 n=1 Tax=Dermacentor albipictus TaxID=60249 RepID=UPI0031FDF9A9
MQTQFIASSKGRAERVQAAKATFTYRWWHGVAATNLIVFTAYFFFVIFVEVHKEPEANLDIGTVYGRTFKNLEVSAFYGVPYAKPPLGFHRFRRPEPMPAGSLSLDGRNPRYPCVQHNLYYGNITLIDASNVSEDCLHLDVYTPTTSSAYEQLRGVGGLGVAGHSAVLVALIDLNFASGGNSYFFSDPRHFVNQTGVVVVVPNYRLGAMGFMRSGKQRAAGNMGLLDQAIMLRWVRDNIFSFGGNPHNIVLMGVGGGAVAAGYHLLSPMTRGFTRRAILHSGSPLMPYPDRSSQDPIEEVALRANCLSGAGDSSVDLASAVACVHVTPTERLRPALTEGHFPITHDSFMPLPYETMLSQSTGHSAQVLVGNVRNEGGMLVAHEFRNLTYKELHTTSRDEITQRLLKYLEPYHIPHLEKIIRCYLANPEKGQQLMNFIDVASELLGDLLYVCPMKRFANLFSDAGNRVNYFVYDYQPEAVKSLKPFHKDATQLDDVLTVFGAQLFPSEMLFSHTIMKHWGDFAKSGWAVLIPLL